MSARLHIVALIPASESALEQLIEDELSSCAAVRPVAHADAALALLRDGHADIDVDIMLLCGLPPESAMVCVDALQRARAHLPVVVLTRASEQPASEALHALRTRPLTDVVAVPWPAGELRARCERVVRTSRVLCDLTSENQQLERRLELMDTMNQLALEIADAASFEQLARAIAQGLFRVAPSGIGAVLLASGEQPCLHLHCPRPFASGALEVMRDRTLASFQSLAGRRLTEERLIVDISGGGRNMESMHEFPSELACVAITLDGVDIGGIALATDVELTPALETLLLFLAARGAETCRRLSAQQEGERHRLALMVESMGDGVVFYNQHTEHVLINPAARRMLDIAPGTDVTAAVLAHRLGFHPLDRLVGAVRRPAQSVHQEVRVGERALRVILAPVTEKDGTQVGVGVVLRDHSEAKELHRRQSEFVSLMSHELRTPLTSIAGILDMLLDGHAGMLSDKQQRYLRLGRQSYDKLDAFIKNILDVARSERNRMIDQLAPLDLHELSREAVERFRGHAEDKQVHLHVRAENSSVRFLGDGPRLAQVLDNLIANAINFTPSGGEVEVHVFGSSVVAEHVGGWVFNTGEPIPPEARERIFGKFEQLADLATREVGGAGLGLTISRAIVEDHGGQLWAETNEHGTRLVFTLPVAPSTDTPADERGAAGASEHGGRSEPKDELPDRDDVDVLVVDDVAHSGFMLTGILRSAGYQVSTARDAESALALGRARPPHLAVISLDSASGANADLVHICAHDPQMRKTAMLIVSPDPGVREIDLPANAEFLSMPVEPGHLLETCARLVHEAGRASATRILVVDDDSAIRLIFRDVLEQAGYEVYDVADGMSALDMAKRCKPHVMLLDIMMPKMDGFQTAERLRADPVTSMTPIIFVSARGETADKVRAFKAGAEDYMVKPFDAEELVARVAKSVARQARELGASPTTQLPGSDIIEAEIDARLRDGRDHAFCYLDLDNLKAFNDYYGYAKADGVIRQTGDIIRDVVAREGAPGDFIGHIAGDDFIFITKADRVASVCSAICSTFDRLVPLYYDRADRERGFIETKDRYGVVRQFPIMTVSIAVLTPAKGEVTRFSELAALAARGKKLAKSLVGSSFVWDDRTILGTPVPDLDALLP